jgi:hypothetical protein
MNDQLFDGDKASKDRLLCTGDKLSPIPAPRGQFFVNPEDVVEESLDQPNRAVAQHIVETVLLRADQNKDLSPVVMAAIVHDVLAQLGDALLCGEIRADDMVDTEVWR